MPFLAMLWGVPVVRRLALYAGVALALVALVVTIFLNGKAAGKAAAAVDGLRRNLEAERRMRDARANSPADRDELLDRLRKGKF